MVGATVAFAEVVRTNHQLSFKVGSALAKLLRTWLDGDDLFKRCKGLQVEKLDLGAKWRAWRLRRMSLPRGLLS